MRRIRTILLPVLALVVMPDSGTAAPVIVDGSYEVTTRLELPHVERWAIDRTVTACLPTGDAIPVPVFSVNNPFSLCRAQNLARDGASIEYDVICPGRASARAHARYSLSADGFTGRVTMVMAAKNMTMTEVVRARRLGICAPQIVEVGKF